MANKNLFKSLVGKLVPVADARNEERAPAYALTPEQALAQYAATGCLTQTFYAKAEEQLSVVLGLCEKVEPEFVAKTAVYARERGLMKDTPALLLAHLAAKDVRLLAAVFPRVVDNGKMLRNFVQIVRSGAAGRKWLDARAPSAVFRASVGQSPSFADVVKMVHPKPRYPEREALYGYLVGRK